MNQSVSTMTGKTKVKIVFLGGQAVGKSSIIEKYIHDNFDETANPTVGIDFLAKNISFKGRNYRLQLWDTAGQQRFRSLIPSYLKDAHVAIVVFDVTSKQSLTEVEMWNTLFTENKNSEGFVMLVGNKVDLDEREVPREDAEVKAKQLGITYHEISAKTGENLDELFLNLVEMTADKSANARTLNEGKTVIREEVSKVDETDTKLEEADPKEGVQVTDNVVLRNEKIGGKGGERKACC